jgi:hypothetical protein
MSIDLYDVRPRKDHRGGDLISDALPFGRLWMASRMQSATQSATQSFQPFTQCGDSRLR